MPNPHGHPIWYELMTRDPAGAKSFYDPLFGWTIADKSDQPGMDYRMIDTGHGNFVGGMMPLTAEMQAGGAAPTWLVYLGVDDVDGTAAKVKDQAGEIHLEPFDIPGAGRAAMGADPQGNPFYLMRGSSPEDSTAYERMGMGKCNWNKLISRDHAATNAFFTRVFDWRYPHKMEMPGDLGDYTFVHVGGSDEAIGATMQAHPDHPPGWTFYFRAPDIEVAATHIAAAGGKVLQGPMEVPGGDMVLVATDPEGVRFGVAAPGKQPN